LVIGKAFETSHLGIFFESDDVVFRAVWTHNVKPHLKVIVLGGGYEIEAAAGEVLCSYNFFEVSVLRMSRSDAYVHFYSCPDMMSTLLISWHGDAKRSRNYQIGTFG